MNNVTLYRTNSYTGNTNPFGSAVTMLTTIRNTNGLFRYLSSTICNLNYSIPAVSLINEVMNNIDSPEAFNPNPYDNLSQEGKEDFINDVLTLREKYFGERIKYCCWFSDSRSTILSRKNGYGKNLCKENGVLRCYDKGKFSLTEGFDILCAYEEIPKLHQDIITNNQLISYNQLQELLAIEESYSNILADTCEKKNVLNLLNRAKKGLLNTRFTPSFEVRESIEADQREKILSDIL